MGRLTLVVLLVCVGLAVASAPRDYMNTPDGIRVHRSCHYDAKNGEVVDVDKLPSCRFKPLPLPRAQIYNEDAHLTEPNPTLVTQMNASWVVPNLPISAVGQVLYFWPGFKDQQPEMGYPVLQPVLQYGQHGAKWELQSWFVWGNEGKSTTAPAIATNPGDQIQSFMEYNPSTQRWRIYGKNVNTGLTSDLTITRANACNCDYHTAMVVFESIMSPNNCEYYPRASTVTFTGLKVNGAPTDAWIARHNMNDCGQNVTVADGGATVKMTWHN